MGKRTAIASALIPGLGQLSTGKKKEFKAIWTGLILSVILFPLPGVGAASFAGIYVVNIFDAYHEDRRFELLDIENWDRDTFTDLKSKIRDGKFK